MDRFSQVDENLFRGGAPSAEDLSILRDVWGVRKIVSLDEDIGKAIAPLVRRAGIKHIIVPLTDGAGENVDYLGSNIKELLGEGGPVFVHCKHGKDRTGMAVAMYRVANGWPVGKALKEAGEFGMGTGLAPHVNNSYYNAVKEFSQDNNFEDIVDLQREDNYSRNYSPAINDTTVPNFGRGSFCPFQDPAGENVPGHGVEIRGKKLEEELIKLASIKDEITTLSPITIHRRCLLSDIRKPGGLWFSDPAKTQGKGNLYKAFTSPSARFQVMYRTPTTVQIQSAKLKDVDIIAVSSIGKNSFYIVIDPNQIESISEEEIGDDSATSDLPPVGQTGDFQGSSAAWSTSSGGTLDGGNMGSAGPVQLPFMSGQGL